MALAILPAIIVSFVVLVALLGTYHIYQAYKRARFVVPDVESTRHIENVEHFEQSPIQLHVIEPLHQQYQNGWWYGSENVVLAHIAPAAKALPHIPEIEYTGGEGLVSPSGRVFLSSEEFKGSKGRTNTLDNFQAQDLHEGRPWNFATDGYGNSSVKQPDLISPKPVRTVTSNSQAELTNTAYDSKQTAAANIWDKISKGELQPSRRKADKKVPMSPNASMPEVLRDPAEFENDAFQDIDLGSSTKEWAKAKVSSAYVTQCPSKQESFDNRNKVVDAQNVNVDRLVSYVKRKQSMSTEAAKLTQPLDRAAETRRRILEATNRMAERKKQEEEERQAEERRQAEEEAQRETNQRKLAGEEQRWRDDERARSLAELPKAENEDPFDTRDSGSSI